MPRWYVMHLGGMLCIHACLTKYAELKYKSTKAVLMPRCSHKTKSYKNMHKYPQTQLATIPQTQ